MIFAIDIEANHSQTSPGEIFPASTSEDRTVRCGCNDFNWTISNQQSECGGIPHRIKRS
jgi:hypothetical protein